MADVLRRHAQLSDQDLIKLLRNRQIMLAGNANLKIFGRLDCAAGRRLKKYNRVFFSSTLEAVKQGYRPCGRCLKPDYLKWKNGSENYSVFSRCQGVS